MKKKRIFSTVMSLVVGVSCISVPTLRTQADSLTGNISIAQNADYRTGVDFNFHHVSGGAAVEGEHVGFTTFVQGETRLVYTLENPTLTPANLPSTAFPEYLDEDKVYAVLALAEKNSASTASAAAGLGSQDYLSNLEYVAATQLAIYKIVAEGSRGYYIEDVGISPAGVNTVAEWLKQQATGAIAANTDGLPIETFIIPDTTLKVEKDRVFTDTTTFADYKFMGPYRITSNKTQNLGVTMSEASVKMFTAIGGSEIQQLKTNQDFYLRFEAKTTYPNFKMDFNIQAKDFAVGTYGNNAVKVVTSAWVPANLTATLTVGDVNSYGTIKVSKFLDGVNTPLSGCKFEVRDMTGDLVAELVTNESGVAFSSNLPSGTYKVKEVDNGQPYNVDTQTYTVEIKQNGSVEPVVSYSTRSSGTLNISVVNMEGGNPVGNSKFQIVKQNDNSLVKEITVDETGVYNNISLPLGNYLLKEVYTNPSYQLNTETKAFSITQEGQILSVTFEKTVTRSQIQFTVTRTNDMAPLSNVNIDVYKADGTWLATLTTASNGVAKVGLPAGTYYGKVKAYTGYAVNANQTYAFTIYGNGETQQSSIKLSVSMGGLSMTVLDDGNNLIQNVEVSIYDSSNQMLSRQVSTADGKVVFSGLPSGQVLFYKVSNVPYGYTADQNLVQFMLPVNGEQVLKEVRVRRSTTGGSSTNTNTNGSVNNNGNTITDVINNGNNSNHNNSITVNTSNSVIDARESSSSSSSSGSSRTSSTVNIERTSTESVKIPAQTASVQSASTAININGTGTPSASTAINVNGVGTPSASTAINVNGAVTPSADANAININGTQVQQVQQVQPVTTTLVAEPTIINAGNANTQPVSIGVGVNPTVLPTTSDVDAMFYLVGGLCLAFSALSALLMLRERWSLYEK